ncbi:MAG: hypothetical protein AAGA03_19925, partial [Planctomycetota bacterium]
MPDHFAVPSLLGREALRRGVSGDAFVLPLRGSSALVVAKLGLRPSLSKPPLRGFSAERRAWP